MRRNILEEQWLADAAASASLVPRERELEQLRQGFTHHRLGLLTGPVGTGKTMLASLFARGPGNALFPGGVGYHFAFGLPSPIPLEQAGASKKLLVLDEAHGITPEQLATVDTLIREDRAASALLISQLPVDLGSRDHFRVDLGGLSRDELRDLLAHRFAQVGGNILGEGLLSQIRDQLKGNPSATQQLASLAARGIPWRDLLAFVRSFQASGIAAPDGRPLDQRSAEYSQLVVDVTGVNDRLLERLHSAPAQWLELSPRQFEEVIAEMLAQEGYEVELTPTSRDGGLDIWAARKDSLGRFLYLVECKRYTPPHKVGVDVVRSLNGVVNEHRANGAAVITTSFFTTGALAYQQKFEHQLKLHDYVALQHWLASFYKHQWPVA